MTRVCFCFLYCHLLCCSAANKSCSKTQTSLLDFDEHRRPRHWTIAQSGVRKNTDGVRSVGDEVADGGQLTVVHRHNEPARQRKIRIQTVVHLVALHDNRPCTDRFIKGRPEASSPGDEKCDTEILEGA